MDRDIQYYLGEHDVKVSIRSDLSVSYLGKIHHGVNLGQL
jgi:hypothetical protein